VLDQSGLYYPNRFARHFLLAMDEVMGMHGLNSVLSMAGLESYIDNLPPDNMVQQFDFAYLASLGIALEDMYGTRGGRGIALRIGRATFSFGFKSFGAMKGIANPAFQALPLEKRTRIGLDALAAIFTKFTDQESYVEETDDSYLLIAEVSPFSWGRSSERPVCHALAGIIQEGMRWSSGGYEFHVHETECRASGSERDIFKVRKSPIGGGT